MQSLHNMCRSSSTHLLVEGSDEHEGLIEQLVDPLLIGLNADNTVVREGR